MPDLFKRTMLKICEGLKKKSEKKKWKILGGWGVPHRPSGMEIPGGWGGLNRTTIRGGDMDIFWNHTIQCTVPIPQATGV